MGIKAAAYLLTFSVGLLSDALESGVNFVAAFSLLAALRIRSRPPDEGHAYGHEKVEYLSSGAEGALIIIAAISIVITSVQRLLNEVPIQRLDLGLGLSFTASLINLIVAQILIRTGRRHHSIALEADGHHLMTDFWTSTSILVGVGAVALTGRQILDPLVALAAAGYIGWTGFNLVRQSVPGDWSVQRGHDLLEDIERDIRRVLPSTTVFTHIEPLEDVRSWMDESLDR